MNDWPRQIALLACLCAIFAQTVGVHLHRGDAGQGGLVQSALTHHPVDHHSLRVDAPRPASASEPALSLQDTEDQTVLESAQETKMPVLFLGALLLTFAAPPPQQSYPRPAEDEFIAHPQPRIRPPLRAPPLV
jgi:hypothetical protein